MKRIQRLIERELGNIRFHLRGRVASLQEIDREEEKFVGSVRRMMVVLRELEFLLRLEIEQFHAMKKKFGRAYVGSRYRALERAIQREVHTLEQEIRSGGELYKANQRLLVRLRKLIGLIRGYKGMSKATKLRQLDMLESFHQRRRRAPLRRHTKRKRSIRRR